MGCWELNPGQPRARQTPYPLCYCSSPWAVFILLFFIYFLKFLLFGSHPVMHRGYSWLCTQELLLVVLKGPYGMLGIKPGLAACKANALPAVLSLQPLGFLLSPSKKLRVSCQQAVVSSPGCLKSHPMPRKFSRNAVVLMVL